MPIFNSSAWSDAEREVITKSPYFGTSYDIPKPEVYAQLVLTALRKVSDPAKTEEDPDCKYFQGAWTQLIKDAAPSANAGAMKKILSDSRAIEMPQRGGGRRGSEILSFRDSLWYDTNGDRVKIDAGAYQTTGKTENLEQRVINLTNLVSQLTGQLRNLETRTNIRLAELEEQPAKLDAELRNFDPRPQLTADEFNSQATGGDLRTMAQYQDEEEKDEPFTPIKGSGGVPEGLDDLVKFSQGDPDFNDPGK